MASNFTNKWTTSQVFFNTILNPHPPPMCWHKSHPSNFKEPPTTMFSTSLGNPVSLPKIIFFFVRTKFFCIVSFSSIKPSTINHINLRIVDDKILFHVCMLIFLALSWKFSVWLFKCLLKPSKKCLQLFGKNSE